MRAGRLVVGVVVGVLAACSRAPAERASGDASAPAAAAGAVDAASADPHAQPVLTGAVSVKGPVDRAKAERIGLFYARVRWAGYKPALATAFNTGHGEYRVVVGFDGRPDAASVFVRIADGEVVDASIAPGDR